LHVVVDVDSGCVINVKLTKCNVHDNLPFKNLITPFIKDSEVLYADKAYDCDKNFRICRKNNIMCGIPVKLSGSDKTKKGPRKDAIAEQLGLYIGRGSHRLNRYQTKEMRKIYQQEWKERVGYGDRWFVEGFFSRYKRSFGESVFSKHKKNVEKEVTTKINLLNLFATMT